MLLNFTVQNYRSFSDAKTIFAVPRELDTNATCSVIYKDGYQGLPAIAIYGANSSGKSNLVLAMDVMRFCVLSSAGLNEGENLRYDPFVLIKGNGGSTLFEVEFTVTGGTHYRYGFAYTHDAIGNEWLFRTVKSGGKEFKLFTRKGDEININKRYFPEGNTYFELRGSGKLSLNANRLFLSWCQSVGGEVSKQVVSWFQNDLEIVSGLNLDYFPYRSSTTQKAFLNKSPISQLALDFFKSVGLDFDGIKASEENVRFRDEEHAFKFIKITSTHKVYNENGKPSGDTMDFQFNSRESAGTKKLFELSAPIFDTLSRGATIVIDELDAAMHPLLAQRVLDLFNKSEDNPNGAQLIFTTHDTHLLANKTLRPDQIWFTEKDNAERTDLYCIDDIILPNGGKLSSDANHERNYINGRYGAIPYMTNN